MHRISAHLRRINESLESLDSELVNYRTCIKNKLLGKLNISCDSDTRLWWHREIQNELKVFHFYASFCMKLLCKDFCLEQHSVLEEEVWTTTFGKRWNQKRISAQSQNPVLKNWSKIYSVRICNLPASTVSTLTYVLISVVCLEWSFLLLLLFPLFLVNISDNL